jgi:hypothetical protein
MLSTMSRVPYSVSVVLDREFGPRLLELLDTGPVWAVDSPANRDSAQKLWLEFPERDHLDGVTVFKTVADCSPGQMLIDEMETIDMHHGVYSADPAYTVLRVFGCELQPEIRKTLAKFGFDSFSRIDDGFEATRPLPPLLRR